MNVFDPRFKLPRLQCEDCGNEIEPGGFVRAGDDVAELEGHQRFSATDLWTDDGKDAHVVLMSPVSVGDHQNLHNMIKEAGDGGCAVVWAMCFTPDEARAVAAELVALADEATRINSGQKKYDPEAIAGIANAAFDEHEKRQGMS